MSSPIAKLQNAFRSFSARPVAGDPFEKYNPWWSQQPRDDYGRWTSGLVHGAYSPVGAGKPQEGDVAPQISHMPGSPFAIGGAYHGNASGWQHQGKALGVLGSSKFQPNLEQFQPVAGAASTGHAYGNGAQPVNAGDFVEAQPKTLEQAQAENGKSPMQQAAKADALLQNTTAYENVDDANAVAGSLNSYGEEQYEVVPHPKGGYAVVPQGLAPKNAPQDAAQQAVRTAQAQAVSQEVFGDHGPFEPVQWKSIGPQKGSNPGGTYEDSDGQKWYVKFYKNPDQAKNEQLANLVYSELAVPVPDTRLVSIDGKDAYASKILSNAQAMNAAAMADHANVAEGFVADAFLANHDVVGLAHDNIVKGPAGYAYRIDNGGSLFFRAQGKPKDVPADKVDELKTLRDKNINAASAEAFKNVTSKQIHDAAQELVATLDDQKILDLVSKAGFAGDEAKKYFDVLKGRRDAIAKSIGELKAAIPQNGAKYSYADIKAAEPDSSLHVGKYMQAVLTGKPDESQMTPGHLHEALNRVYPNKFAAGSAIFHVEQATGQHYMMQPYKGDWSGESGWRIQPSSGYYVDSWPGERYGFPNVAEPNFGQNQEFAYNVPAELLSSSAPLKDKINGMLAASLQGNTKLAEWAASHIAATMPQPLWDPSHKAKYSQEVIDTADSASSKSKSGLGDAIEAWIDGDHEKAFEALDSNPGALKLATEHPFAHANVAHFAAQALTDNTGVQYMVTPDPNTGKLLVKKAPLGALLPKKQGPVPEALGGQAVGIKNEGAIDAKAGSGATYDAKNDASFASKNHSGKFSGKAVLDLANDGNYLKSKTNFDNTMLLSSSPGAREFDLRRYLSDAEKANFSPHDLAWALDDARINGVDQLSAAVMVHALDEHTDQKWTAKPKGGSGDLFDVVPKESAGVGPTDQYKYSYLKKQGPITHPFKSDETVLNKSMALMNAGDTIGAGKMLAEESSPQAIAYYLHHASQGSTKAHADVRAVMATVATGIPFTTKPVPGTDRFAVVPGNRSDMRELLGTLSDPFVSFSSTAPLLDVQPGADLKDLANTIMLEGADKRLPGGIASHALFITNPDDQKAYINAAKALGKDDAVQFLEPYYAALNAQHTDTDSPEVETHAIYHGTELNYPHPGLRPAEIMRQVLSGEAKMPHGANPAALFAKTPDEQNYILSMFKGYDPAMQASRAWFEEFFHQRNRSAASNPHVEYGTHASLPSWAHPGFHEAPAVPLTGAGIKYDSVGKTDATSVHSPIMVPEEEQVAPSYANSLTPSGAGKAVVVGKTAHALSHLKVKPGSTYTQIRSAAGKKAAAVLPKLLAQQAKLKEQGADLGDPFASLPSNGKPHAEAAHTFHLSQEYFPALLQAARSAVPARSVLEAITKQTYSRRVLRALAKSISDPMLKQLGVSPQEYKYIASAIAGWTNSTQDAHGRHIRVASNLLRGRAPWENAYITEAGTKREQGARSIASKMSPAYFKALLVHKAVTQAIMERFADQKTGRVPLLRGIRDTVASKVFGKTATAAIFQQHHGSKVKLREQTLAGYTLNPDTSHSFGGGARIFRHVRPEEIWHAQMASPTHSTSYEPEAEIFVHSNAGGGTIPVHADENVPAPLEGDFLMAPKWSAPGAGTADSAIREHFGVLAGFGKSVRFEPTDWDQVAPRGWVPSQELIDRFIRENTGPDGVLEIDLDRDPGLRGM